MSDTKYYSKREIKNRGWTDTAIKNFLGDPDKKVRNPRSRRNKIQLFKVDRVHETESTPEFAQWKRKSAARREAALRAAETKRQKTLDRVESRLDSVVLKKSVRGLSREELRRRAVESFEQLELDREIRSGGGYSAEVVTSRRSEGFFDRIEVNFLRHEGTVYDRELGEYFGATGVGQAVDAVRERVYGLIAAEYPHLGVECRRQLDVRRERELWARGQDVSSRSARVSRSSSR